MIGLKVWGNIFGEPDYDSAFYDITVRIGEAAQVEEEQIMVAIDQKEEETHIVEEKVEEPIDLKVDPPVMSIFQISSTGLMTLIFD